MKKQSADLKKEEKFLEEENTLLEKDFKKIEKKVKHVSWLQQQKDKAKKSMDAIVTSAKSLVVKGSSKKDEKTHNKKHHKNSKKSDSKKDSKTIKDHNNKKDAKSAVPAAVADKNVTAAVPAKNATATVPEVPAPVEEQATTIIPSLSSFFSSWSKPGPHPAYVATTVDTKKPEDAKKTVEPKKADSKK